MVDTLKPCPFCGAKPYASVQNSAGVVASDRIRFRQFVWCDDCGARGPERDTESEAIDAWNSSPANPELVEALRKAQQLADIATDWNLTEVEIDGEMVSTYDLKDEFRAAFVKQGSKS